MKNTNNVAWFVFGIVVLNTLAFVLLVSNPLLVQDGWYFLDVFVSKALNGNLEFADFFVKRESSDHAQPLGKLILLMELRWFDLDFVPQAVIGLFFAVATSLLSRYVIFQFSGTEPSDFIKNLCWILITAILLSLNSTGVWTWPLVALSYTSHVFVFGFMLITWVSLKSGKVFWLGIYTIFLALITDDTAILAALAVIGVSVVFYIKGGSRRYSISTALTIFVCVVAVQILIRSIAPIIGDSPDHPGIDALREAFLKDGWWKWVILPLSNSVLTKEISINLLNDQYVILQLIIGITLTLGHCWFWFKLWKEKIDPLSFLSGAIMLFFYLIVAGIIWGRVSIFGSDYLNQPRYVLFYQLNLIAIILMLVNNYSGRTKRYTDIKNLVVTGLAGLMLVVQIPVSIRAWNVSPYIRAYYSMLAVQIVEMGENPKVELKNCAPELPPCEYTPERRMEAIGLLQKYELNIFSNKFRRMHGFDFVEENTRN